MSKTLLLHIVWAYILSIALGTHCLAQEWSRNLVFKSVTDGEGLPNQTINSFFQDSRGYMWIGTARGLINYDGIDFETYQPDNKDDNSIRGKRIYTLSEDSLNNLWIGTDVGLSKFNYVDLKFTNYRSDDGFDRVMDIAYDERNKRMWLACWEGKLKYLDFETGIVHNFDHDVLLDALAIKLLLMGDELYIGTSNYGVYKLNINSFAAEEFCNTDTGLFQIPSNDISDLHLFENKLMIGSDGGGLIVYHLKDRKHTFYNSENINIPSLHISSIAHNSEGKIYVGTNQGLAIYKRNMELISMHQKEDGNLTTLCSNSIQTVFSDKDENLWVGTFQNGVSFQGRESQYMSLIKKKYVAENTLSGGNIRCFAQDNNHGMWIGTRENGLNYYKDGHYTHFKTNSEAGSLPDNHISDIYIDGNDVLWVATVNHGLAAFEHGKFKHWMKDDSDINAIQSNRIRKIIPDNEGNLWLATNNGLEMYHIASGIFQHHFLESDEKELNKRFNIRTLLLGSDEKFYIGTSTGFYIYDPVSGKSQVYKSDQMDVESPWQSMIYELFENSKGRIWMGTLGWGLISYDTKINQFQVYNENNGFPDNFVKSIEEDDVGNLWIGTNSGIVKFTPENEKAVIIGMSYGLQNTIFNQGASLHCNDGRLVFGGIEGFNVFRPKELELEKADLEVTIRELKIFDDSNVLEKTNVSVLNISLADTISLSYGQSKRFKLSFSTMQFSSPTEVKYAYKLEGFENEWNYIDSENIITFTNLKPREYVFHVRASDDGLWNHKVRKLTITIAAPWYMKIWFKIGILICCILLLVTFYYNKIRLHKQRERKLEKLVNEKNYEITSQNEELLSSNEELSVQNEEVVRQKEYIDQQNIELQKAYGTLEERVAMRTLELNESNRKLNKSVKELDRFVYSASHDLSAPLKSVLGLVNIAKLESKEKNLDIHLDYIEKSIKKQDRVIKSLIQYSRNSRLDLKIVPIKFTELVDQVISELKYIPGADVVDMINLVSKDISIRSDEQRIKTILNNLLSNGINYSDPNKNDSFVKIQFTKTERAWQLKVKDNGQGIPEDQQEKIFEMFHRANEESDGSGLGLFIVKEAVERLGGKISLESTGDDGAEFVLDFPYS